MRSSPLMFSWHPSEAIIAAFADWVVESTLAQMPYRRTLRTRK
jgi:hypothetical protein